MKSGVEQITGCRIPVVYPVQREGLKLGVLAVGISYVGLLMEL